MGALMAVGVAIAVVPLIVGIVVQERHYRREDALVETAEDALFLSELSEERVAA